MAYASEEMYICYNPDISVQIWTKAASRRERQRHLTQRRGENQGTPPNPKAGLRASVAWS